MKIKCTLLLLLSISCFGQKETNGAFKAAITSHFELKYLLYQPENSQESKPLLLFLHGSGEKGSDLEKIKTQGPFKYLKNNKIDAYVLAPQCPDGKYWNSEELYLLLQKIIAENNIDPNRIYLTGLSMGAWGAWNLAYAHPELFAALVPIAGYVDRIPMIENCKLATLPIRIYHGLLDNVVDVEYSMAIYKKLKECNKDIKLEIFDDAMHDSWIRVYEQPEIYNWMLKQTRKAR